TLQAVLPRQGYEESYASTAETTLQRVREADFDAMLTDLNMDGMGGIELCRRVNEVLPDMPVIVVTGYASMDSAIAALRAGAYDFITKPVDTNLLSPTVTRAVQHRRLGQEVTRLRKALPDAQRFGEIVGKSPAMRRVFDLVARVAESDASVLIFGESGTGKELIARSIHDRSRRKHGPFVALNCAAVPPSLNEREPCLPGQEVV